MRASHNPDRLDTTFTDAHPVTGAGLLLPAPLAHPFGLKALVERYHDLGAYPDERTSGTSS